MEKIIYRKSLDVHKNGIQFTIQGVETSDNMSRRIEISLMASGDAYDLPLEGVVAQMYITTPNAKEPSIEACTIKDNVVVYDVLPIVVPGITEMQIKLIKTGIDGAKAVLVSPRFAVEVLLSNADDDSAEQSTSFTALEDAVAKANAVYDARLARVEFDDDCIFRAYYADGTVYETDAIKEGLINGHTLLSKSYAVGDTGAREHEATDNAKYYASVSRSSSIEAREDGDHATDILAEVRKHGVYTSFDMDFETGELQYVSPNYDFDVDEESGELNAIGKDYSFEDVIASLVAEDIADDVAQILADASSGATAETHYASDLSADFEVPILVRWDSATAFTPYASGLTTSTEGFAIVHGSMTGNHTIISWAVGDEDDNYFCHTVASGTAKGWNGFFPKSGGNLTGPLGVNGGKGKFSATDEYSILEAVKDEDNTRQIRIANPTTEGIPLLDAVKLSDVVGGVKTDYKLFGEHNIESLIGVVGNLQMEAGAFTGIGINEIHKNNRQTIEFKKVKPTVVIIMEGELYYVVVNGAEIAHGRYAAQYLCYFYPKWEDDGCKLIVNNPYYRTTTGSLTSLPPDTSELQTANLKFYLAEDKTYTYVAFGTAIGGEA